MLTHDIANKPLRSITPKTVEDFRDDLRGRGVGEQSILKTLKLMQTILERAVKHGKIASNPVKAVRKPKAGRTKTVRPISPAGVEAIRAQLRGQHAVFASVLAYAGLRPGEARALQWGDIGKQTIYVQRSVEDDGSVKPTKTGNTRSVRLLDPLASDLAELRRASGSPPDSVPVFPRADGRAWTGDDWQNFRARIFRRAADKAGVDIGRPYNLRHSAASLWLHEGKSPIHVAAWMGHSLAMLSSTYAHVIDDLDPDEQRPSAVDMIHRARARDISVT